MPVGADGRPCRGPAGLTLIDGLPTSDADLQQYRKRIRRGPTQSTQPLSGSRIADTGRLDFAVERDYNAEAQVMGMEMEGVDIAVLYPTTGLSLIARDNLDPRLSLALCQAYNNWIHDFCQYSPDRLKFVAMLPVHDVHLACRELLRCVRELGADRMCVSTDYPHFDSNFPHVAENLLKNVPREIAAAILMGGAHLYGFTEADFKKADAAAAAAEKRTGVPAAR